MSNPEEMVTCPYNRAHMMVSHRMQFHLVKCREQHQNAEKVCCPFNRVHVVNKVELPFHLKTCKDSITGEREFFKVGGPPKPAMSVPVPNNVPCFVDNEVWGDEDVCTGISVLHKVKEIAKEKPTLSNKICVSKSIRMQHKLDERRRFIDVYDSHNNRAGNNESENRRAPSVTEKALHAPPSTPVVKSDENTDQSNANKLIFDSTQTSQPSVATSQLESATEEKADNGKKAWTGWNTRSTEGLAHSLADIQLKESIKQREEAAVAVSNTVANQSNVPGGSTGWSGWATPRPPSNDSTGEPSVQPQAPRDKANPWKTRTAANFSNQPNLTCQDFPGLPVTGRGRGRHVSTPQ